MKREMEVLSWIDVQACMLSWITNNNLIYDTNHLNTRAGEGVLDWLLRPVWTVSIA